jgi:hypothetical protein
MPNTYAKYCPNVFCAKCTEPHEKGETIVLETKYGKQHECIVFNLIFQKDCFYYYSVVRADGFNFQEWAKRRAERLENASLNAKKKSNEYYEASQEGKDFLQLAEPIKIGHHSEKRHRALIERNWNRMGKSVEFSEKAEDYKNRVSYWEQKAETINLSMPESIEYYEFKVEQSAAKHEGMKNGTIERSHSMSLIYAKKELNEAKKNLLTAQKLWG